MARARRERIKAAKAKKRAQAAREKIQMKKNVISYNNPQKMDRREYEKMLAQQSVAKRNNKKRKTRKSFISIFLVIIALIVCAFVCIVIFFKVDKIEVITPEGISQDEILKICNFKKGENILRIDTNEAKNMILDKYVDIDSVIIEKDYPTKIKIIVEKAVSEFAIKTDYGYSVVSKNGRIISSQPIKPEGLLVVSGFEQTSEIGTFFDNESKEYKNYLTVIKKFYDGGWSEITQINLKDEFNINILYKDRLKISIGNTSDMDYKLKIAKQAYEKDFADDDFGVIDVSVRGSAYVRKGKNYIASFFSPEEDAQKAEVSSKGD